MKLTFNDEYIPYLRKNARMSSEYKEGAKLILQNKLFLHSNLDVIQFEDKYNWDYQHIKSARTYQVYIQSLSYVNPLIKMYEQTEDETYYLKAKEIITSWLSYQKNSDNNLIWKEHPVSNRVLTFLYFLSSKECDYTLEKNIISSIKKHLDYLIDPKNYLPTNHGLIMDQSILVSSLFINENKVRELYIETAKNRLEKLIYRDFSYKGVHLENSPEYHIMVTGRVKKSLEILKLLYPKIDYRIENIINRSNKYLPYIINNNKELPLIGDTSYRKLNIDKSFNDFLDYEAGICVFNNITSQSTLIFNSGFNNHGHKQLDDLSFIFSTKKNNIFIDGGKYSYDKSSNMVKYIMSPLAHNSFTTRDMKYSTTNLDASRILYTEKASQYKYVVGEISLKDKRLVRHLILLNNDSFIIFDKGVSEKEEEWIQNFLLCEDLNLHKAVNNKLLLNNEEIDYEILFDNSSLNILFGQSHKACYSKYFDKLIDTHRVENISKGLKCEFLTIIKPVSNEQFNIELKNNCISINTDEYEIDIKLFD